MSIHSMGISVPYQFKSCISTVRADLSLPTPFWGPPPKCDFQHQQYVGYVAGGAIDQQYPQHLDTSLGPNAPGTAGRLQLLVVIRNTSIFEIRLLSTVTFKILICIFQRISVPKSGMTEKYLARGLRCNWDTCLGYLFRGVS